MIHIILILVKLLSESVPLWMRSFVILEEAVI